ncbi:hypothetical protein PN498_14065 [Oscillatoria sp. CS-180]|uniref:hypothetical protein n=1 Tax=Oscillatoria sp. CS-180 TaxID=3021720 RepID=UPI0023304D17|nr:hypothetical protein [Oscillatoria sp. CS-180]MDB9527123.1 hypothetical protein [Oscillatoria sp. CS-180]
MLDILLNRLRLYLPPNMPSLPSPTVTVVQLTEQPAGLGNWIGTESRANYAAVALKGTRLNTVMRFQVWASQADMVSAAIANLQQQILLDRDALRADGVLSFTVAETSLPQFESALNAWTQTTDYQILFEHQFEDADGAEGLIARIPIDVSNPFSDSTVVTGRLTRWDTAIAPALSLRGRFTLGQLSALVFTLPGTPPTGGVTLTRTFVGATGTPQSFATIADFLNAIAGTNPTTRHAQITFGSLTDFLDAMTDAGEVVRLGDQDEDGQLDPYQPKVLTFDPAIDLTDKRDRLEVAYEEAAFDQSAVVYLRGV